jgi:putative endonuclease
VLYIGITSDIERRLYEHKNKIIPGFTEKYSCNKLIYIETYSQPDEAIAREKQLKGWSRKKKLDLIYKQNMALRDLSESWSWIS